MNNTNTHGPRQGFSHARSDMRSWPHVCIYIYIYIYILEREIDSNNNGNAVYYKIMHNVISIVQATWKPYWAMRTHTCLVFVFCLAHLRAL